MSREKLLISFSGGRTSAYMTHKILSEMSEKYETKVVFANTGQEHENTLRFVDQCDRLLGFDTIWVEAVPQEGRKSSAHKVVSYTNASKLGEPYEAVIQKYGIPNKAYPHCTRELKLNPIGSYMKSIGWKSGAYRTAVGIRSDEMRRVRASAETKKIVYPLVDWFPKTKSEINAWWNEQSFYLELQEHQGNCTWCWKKSSSKLLRLVKESPEVFLFPKRMEETYGLAGHNVDGTHRVFFREHTSVDRLFELANKFCPDEYVFPALNENEDSGCGESCELYETETVEKVSHD